MTARNTSLLLGLGNAMAILLFAILIKKGIPFNNYTIIISVLILFGLNFIILFFILKQLIYKRIKGIFRMIDGPVSQSDKGNWNSSLLNEAETEVRKWVQKNEREAAEKKKMETYRKEFLGNVSHELKTPVFNVLGFVETLLDGGLDDDEINRKYLKKAEKNVHRLIAIIEDLEQISKFESNRLTLDMKPFDLCEVVREVMDSLDLTASKKGIQLQFISPVDVVIKVYGDSDQIFRVLNNLITNSIKYGKEKGSTTLRILNEKDKVKVEVSDDGIGIDEKHIPRLFERFYRVDSNRSRHLGGTGLGLAIVKHIIEAHGQSISVRSTLGEGSTFSFTLNTR